MANETKPIKRSEQLAPLSREHHEVLLFVWKIRQGIRYEIVINRITAFIDWFWQHHLAQHFKKEEEVVPQLLPEGHLLVQQMFSEHQEIKRQLEKVQTMKDADTIEQMAQLIYDHIRFEERKLYVEAEQKAGVEQLHKIAAILKKEKVTAVWNDVFWIK